MVRALPRSALVQVGKAHVQSSIYVAQPTSDSQESGVLPLSFTVTVNMIEPEGSTKETTRKSSTASEAPFQTMKKHDK
jgi:hypothetical protein